MATSIATDKTKKRLADLLNQDLAFRGGDKPHPLHSIHAFAAKFPAQLPRHFIEGLSSPGEVVLDPMAGSGSTLVEGWLLSRKVVGVDLDPLALKLCRAKTARVNPASLEEAGQRALETAGRREEQGDPLESFRGSNDAATNKFIDYWFLPETQQELAALMMAVAEEEDPRLRNILEVALSSVIVTKSGGVSMARDLAHSRPHRVADKTPRRPFRMFETQLRQAVRAFAEAQELPADGGVFLAGDSRSLPLTDESVDLIVTSPPYANAIDYMRAHKFSLVWLGQPIANLSDLRGKYIGAERQDTGEVPTLPTVAQQAIAEPIRNRPSEIPHPKQIPAGNESGYRGNVPGNPPWPGGHYCCWPLHHAGSAHSTQDYLAAIAEQVGFEVVGVPIRPLDRDRRMMPARWGNRGDGDNEGIELRLHEEFVIGLVKV